MTRAEQIAAAIARKDATFLYERGEFNIDGMPVICTYRASDPYRCIACRPDPASASRSYPLG